METEAGGGNILPLPSSASGAPRLQSPGPPSPRQPRWELSRPAKAASRALTASAAADFRVPRPRAAATAQVPPLVPTACSLLGLVDWGGAALYNLGYGWLPALSLGGCGPPGAPPPGLRQASGLSWFRGSCDPLERPSQPPLDPGPGDSRGRSQPPPSSCLRDPSAPRPKLPTVTYPPGGPRFARKGYSLPDPPLRLGPCLPETIQSGPLNLVVLSTASLIP